jgi:hypothetical protein
METNKEKFDAITKQLEMQTRINKGLIASLTSVKQELEDVSRITQDLRRIQLGNSSQDGVSEET